MATIYANASGAITGLAVTDRDREMHTRDMTGKEQSLEFDETTNAELLAALQANDREFTLQGNTLRRRGQAVPIAPDSQRGLDRKAKPSIEAKITSGQALSPVEQQQAIRILWRKMMAQ